MKKIFFLLAFLFAFTAINAQNYGIITGWGTAADTLVASATKSYEFTYVGSVASLAEIAIFTDSISGAPAYTAVLYKKMGTFNYVTTGDTITYAGGSDNVAHFKPFRLSANKYKVTITATSATQKSRLYLKGTYRQ